MEVSISKVDELYFKKRYSYTMIAKSMGVNFHVISRIITKIVKTRLKERTEESITKTEMRAQLLEDVLEVKRNSYRHILTVGDVFSNTGRMFNRNTYKEILNEEY